MCSNASPSVKPDGTTDAATLAADYEEFLLDIDEQPLPGYRADELRARVEAVRGSLAGEGVAGAGQLQRLLSVVTEALADVRGAAVVAEPDGRDLSAAVPGAGDTGAAYEVTAAEQEEITGVLIELLFTVVETPTQADRRRVSGGESHDGDSGRNGDDSETRASDGDADASNADTGRSFEAAGYAGPE
ncbi:hypothetical protein [Halobaculum sp. MBLA0143]|uniref:hypothetical protein n=1 Tax=Halobaculum sp. MBLA0143 TaxID=3079933 RepID=UPI0035248904